MLAGQTLVANDGYEVALFPLVALYDYQDEGGTGSHEGTYNIDFHGYMFSGNAWVRQTQAPIYAPCTCKLVYKYPTGTAGGNGRTFQSVNQVHTPGGLRYIMFYFGHDANPIANTLNEVFNQGAIIAHTGNYGVSSGDHTHTCMGEGTWQGWNISMTNRPSGHQDFTNHIHYWEAVYVNNTKILQGRGHNWVEWDEPVPPTPTYVEYNRFPWVLYARKFRERRNKSNRS